jgi:disulfide bond formation protein DsbB
MSSSPSTQANALIPTIFLIGVTALLIYFAIPRPYRDPIAATPTPVATMISVAVIEPTPEDHITLMALGLEEVPSSGVQTGSRLFSTTCTACHGSDAKGILGLGKPLIDSEFVNSLNDDELVAFLHEGRTSSDPENTTGVAMPAKGGNPSLTDGDMNAIVDYMRSLNGATVVDDIVGVPTAVPTVRPFQAINLNAFGGSEATTSPSASETPAPEITEVTPLMDASPSAATPVTSYGYETQGTATEAPSAPLAMTPTTAYSYHTAPDITNVPPVYDYQTQGTAGQP